MLGQGKKLNMYIDSKYAFLVVHAHATIQKERGLLTSKHCPIKRGPEILQLLEAIHLLKAVARIHCRGHQRDLTPIAQEKSKADGEAEATVLRVQYQHILPLLPFCDSPIEPEYPLHEEQLLKEQGRQRKKDAGGETSETWVSLLPIALLRIHNTSRAKINIIVYEMLYRRPLLTNDPETASLALQKFGIQSLPTLGTNQQPKIRPGDKVLVKTWKEGSPAQQLQPKWKGPFSVTLVTPAVVKELGLDSWIYLSRMEPAISEAPDQEPEVPINHYTCEPVENLMCLIRRQPKDK
ncbi:Gag-Pol polyprotein [Plecturocebus cupreus]